MRLFGFEIKRAPVLNTVSGWRDGWRRIIEPFAGAWQQNEEETQADLLCYPTLYACVSRIATDIGKLPFQLMRKDANGIWEQIVSASYSPVLKKPNGYQTAQQFRESWMLSKLTQGNTYALKRRDNRGIVVALYVLDPCRVVPLVSESGAVFYRLYVDNLNTIPQGSPVDGLVFPASEIIHDRCIAPHHPLIGVPPLCAAYWPAIKNLRILKSSAEFFGNNSQPGGILTAPAGMSERDAEAVKAYWQAQFTGDNAGRIAVIGADMKFTSFAMKGADAQLVEQMRYSDEQVCQPFGIPPFKIGIGSIPAGLGVDAINQLYYADALQTHIEAMEYLLDEGLNTTPYEVMLDLEPLLRMDEAKRAEVVVSLINGKALTPDEGRKRIGYGPTAGGNTLWGQHQDYPLGTLAERNDLSAPEPEPEPEQQSDEEEESRFIGRFNERMAAIWTQ